jgi:hypothetical protein
MKFPPICAAGAEGSKEVQVSTYPYQPNNFVYVQHRPSMPGLGSRLLVAGWLGLIGALNLFYAIAVLADSDIFITTASWLVGDARPWGWLMLIVALIQLAAAPAVALGRKPAIVIAVLSALAHIVFATMFMFSDSVPLGIILIFIDVNVLGASALAWEKS